MHAVFMLIFVTPEDVLEKTVQFIAGAKSLSLSNLCFSFSACHRWDLQGGHNETLALAQAMAGKRAFKFPGRNDPLINLN